MIDKIIKNVSGISFDSREVKPGYAFFSISNNKDDELYNIQDSIENGAKFIITSLDADIEVVDKSVNIVKVKNPKLYLSKAASLFYPKQPKYTVGITGTNGKTSSVNFFQQICHLLAYKSCSIGTLGIITSEEGYKEKDAPTLTSPYPISLHKTLNDLYEADYTHLAIETSSHGIEQDRITNVNFHAVGFTNFSQDHLDYHKSMKSYFDAKSRIFSEILEPNKYAVLNSDIDEYSVLKDICDKRKIKIIDYGEKANDIRIVSFSPEETEVNIFGGKYVFTNKIKGKFQVYNILCSVGLAISSGIQVDKIMSVIESLKAAKGRLDFTGKINNADIYIDYAHTPDSLKIVLQTLRGITKERLCVVFGCGGERDPIKRKLMGEVAKNYADFIVVTEDNPRGEDPRLIRKDIMLGCPNATEIEGRGKAIEYAISHLKSGDVLVIAGKGHENYQLINGKKIHFSDFEEVEKAIS
ncbi:MAG: UDP-N-acetylmuramoyl-L-alanyl-D-glutamate--2,6-diaminopimelate ligase [Candidatus Midichloriaceae bacterium]|jgi:UDP-N-acetylmuramoyl-L-alanyl-D-glutamate--2,6-diaminopimelate ligase